MVAATNSQQLVALHFTACRAVLQGEFDGDFDCHRSGIGKKHMVEPGRSEVDQGARKFGCAFMGEAAKHDMGHALELLAHGRIELRVTIAVDGRPPGGHAVDQLAAVGELQTAALGSHYRKHRRRIDQRAVRMPDMLTVVGEPGRRLIHDPARTCQRAAPGG